jgi:hypothetical protein
MKKHLLFAALIAAAFSLAVLVFAKSSARPGGLPRQTPSGSSRSLREKARSEGRHVVFANPTGVKRFNDAAALTRQSTLVVTGIVEGQASRFNTPEESTIVTDSQVRVQDVLKGDAAPGEYITVREPGGLMQFEDGTSAEVRMPDYWKSPAAGKSYVFFLKQKGAVYLLFGGPQGLFELNPAGGVSPQARPEDALSQRYEGKGRAEFLEEVRQATQQP